MTSHTNQPAYLAAGAFVGVYLLFSIRVAKQWEKPPFWTTSAAWWISAMRFAAARRRRFAIPSGGMNWRILDEKTNPWGITIQSQVERERQARVILGTAETVPSSAVETMGLGGMLGTVALGKPVS